MMTTTDRKRLEGLRETLSKAEAECTRQMIQAERLAGDNHSSDEWPRADWDELWSTIKEALKHARIAANIKRQIAELGSEVTL